MKKMHKSGISAMKNIVETESKTVGENVSDLRIKLEKSQEMSKDLDIKLCKSQIMQKESSDELKQLKKEQKESNEELKKLHKESSNEISNLKKDISELVNFLKNEKKSTCENAKLVKADNNGIVSASDLCVPPKVMTSQSSSMITLDPTSKKRTLKEAQSEDLTQSNSTLQASNIHNLNNFSFSAAQASTMDQSQLSGKPLISNIKIEDKQMNESEDTPMVGVEKDKDVSVEESKDVQKISVVGDNKGISLDEPKDNENISVDENKETKEESISKFFIKRSFDAFTNVSNNTSNLFRDVLKFQPGILYMVMFLLMMLIGGCRAAPIQDQDIAM
jgi:light-regulated signal transduction histidine kinase (bacteriophytochrome)